MIIHETDIVAKIEKFNKTADHHKIKQARLVFDSGSQNIDGEYFECCVCNQDDVEILTDDEFERFSDFEKHIEKTIRKEKLQKLNA